MKTSLSHAAVARLLAFLDAAPESDLDVRVDGLRLRVTAWYPETATAAAPAPSPSPPAPVAAHACETPAPRIGRFRAEPILLGQSLEAGSRIGAVVGRDGAETEVVAPMAGTVVEICAADGELVEHGQVLAVLEA